MTWAATSTIPSTSSRSGACPSGSRPATRTSPCDKGGKPVRSGKWQIMINGESYKVIVAEAAKKALGEENILERVFIVKLVLDEKEDNRIAAAVGFSTRENKIYVHPRQRDAAGRRRRRQHLQAAFRRVKAWAARGIRYGTQAPPTRWPPRSAQS